MTARRNTLIGLVHAGAAKLFDSDDDRRAWQQARTGHESCRDMTTEQVEALVDELRRKGALAERAPKRAGRKPFNRSPYMDKIEAMLADMGLSWQYAESIAWRITGGRGLKPNSQPGNQRLEWVRGEKHFKGIIAALSVEQEKRATFAEIVDMLNELGEPIEAVDSLVPPNLRGVAWQRNRAWLRTVRDTLAQRLVDRMDEDVG